MPWSLAYYYLLSSRVQVSVSTTATAGEWSELRRGSGSSAWCGGGKRTGIGQRRWSFMPPCKYPPQAARASQVGFHISLIRLPPLLAPAALKLAAGSARVYTDRGRVPGGRRKRRPIEFGGGEICLLGGRRRQPRHRESQLICRCCPFQETIL
jgi:hypothetical protein